MYRRFGEICYQHHSIFSSAAADDDNDADRRTSRSAGTLQRVPEHSRLCSHSHKNVKYRSIKINVNKGVV
jgi:hypothetical protein